MTINDFILVAWLFLTALALVCARVVYHGDRQVFLIWALIIFFLPFMGALLFFVVARLRAIAAS